MTSVVEDYGLLLLRQWDACNTYQERRDMVERLHGVDYDTLAMAIGRREMAKREIRRKDNGGR